MKSKICISCKRELQLDKKNFVVINYGDSYKYTDECRSCIKSKRWRKTINGIIDSKRIKTS